MPSTSSENNPLKDVSLTKQLQQDYEAKTTSMRNAGKKKILSGEYKPFPGYSRDELRRAFCFQLEIDPEGTQAIQQRIITPLRELAQRLGVTAIFAGHEDLHSHITLDTGIFTNGLPPEIRDTALAYLVSNQSHLTMLSQALAGARFTFSNLVIGPNAYISAQFDESQATAYRARLLIECIMQRAIKHATKNTNLNDEATLAPPYSYLNIFHTTVFRLTEKMDTSMAEKFLTEAEAIAQDLKNNPISISVSSIFLGTSEEYADRYAHHLFKD